MRTRTSRPVPPPSRTRRCRVTTCSGSISDSKTTSYSFELYGENVGNSHGITDYQNNGGVNQRGLANFLQPRTIGVQLGVKF